MNAFRTSHMMLRSLTISGAMALAMLPLAAPNSFAIDNAKQILVGGGMVVGDSINYTAPGLSVVFNSSLFGGDDTLAAQLRIPVSGKIGKMRFSIVTQNVPSGGGFLVQVLKNGAVTGMTCNFPPPATKSASCTNTKTVIFNSGDKISMKIDTDYFGGGDVAFTHIFVVD